jgi:hypothetical protein
LALIAATARLMECMTMDRRVGALVAPTASMIRGTVLSHRRFPGVNRTKAAIAIAVEQEPFARRRREGLPRLPDLEFAIYEKAGPDKATPALAALPLTLAQGPSRQGI